MLRSLNEIASFQLLGIDEEIGRCKDFLFDDQSWVIRYMLVDTNKWLPGGKKVLISPISLGEPDWEQHEFPINLTLERVKNSPSLEEHQPISHQYEVQLFKYYGYGNYWMGNDLWGTYPFPSPLVDAQVLENAAQVNTDDRHLRSTEELTGYGIQAQDKKIGHIDDFILNDESWSIPYIVVDTNNWLPGGRKVLISNVCIESINWDKHSITVKLSAE
ncbi:PRC-barrel domain-containing protein [Pseudoalteromonas tunicata]|jgi:uncharacterized protein YrrD|uniref:PRC-barrel domain-containing protein n=1 Tax=Pseudoalteromonas tunicata D2 TaxID=87626 RepID=A4CDS6_9GAMM|nr:PRC-barrel domain-containing protein [Pseudoalteromonas tunicata]ATC96390.1 hypothetical protein PTUN_a4181 [Pseudoalteromonas tunicata]AXT31883.1 PRC-barrel domain containing protein [Pseudoalteromonas tunicata]EAR27118.1 hypothetical protein PTD2_05590 [Pseudoalteromonas tunicata D2]